MKTKRIHRTAALPSFGALLSLGALLVVTGCVEGRSAPSPTEMVSVAGGLFTFGSDEICYNDEDNTGASRVGCEEYNPLLHVLKKVYPTRVVYIPAFEIDAHEVTNLQYEYCVAMGGCSEPGVFNLGTAVFDYYLSAKYADYPVVNVRWDQAKEYCEFVGKRLPTEYEWERAAAGPSVDEDNLQDASRKRVYPFNEDSDDVAGCEGSDAALVFCSGNAITRPAGTSSYDRVREGGQWIYDMAGNVSEWVLDPWVEDITCESELESCADCFACSTSNRVCQISCRLCSDCRDAGDLCFRQCTQDPDYTTDVDLPGWTEGEDLPAVIPDDFANGVLDNGVPVCIRYPGPPDQDTCGVTAGESDCGPVVGQDRGYRGGNYNTRGTSTCTMRAADRSQRREPDDYAITVGFRCARSAE